MLIVFLSFFFSRVVRFSVCVLWRFLVVGFAGLLFDYRSFLRIAAFEALMVFEVLIVGRIVACFCCSL